jgi:hypothetical protein
MNSSIRNFLPKIEIAWGLVWAICLILFYLYLGFNSFSNLNLDFVNIILTQYILQIIFIVASLLSLGVFFIKYIDKQSQAESQNDLLSEGGRIVFPVLNITFYVLELFDLPFIKNNLSFLWLILPWLLWLPIVIDLSTQVKREFSWIK